MYPHYVQFSSSVDRARVAPLERGRVIAAAIASAMASSMALPSTSVDNAQNYYATQLQIGANRLLAELAENLPFDRKAAVEYVRALWLVRYGFAYPSGVAVFDPAASFFDTMGGVPNIVAPETYAFLNTNKEAILLLGHAAKELLVTIGTPQ